MSYKYERYTILEATMLTVQKRTAIFFRIVGFATIATTVIYAYQLEGYPSKDEAVYFWILYSVGILLGSIRTKDEKDKRHNKQVMLHQKLQRKLGAGAHKKLLTGLIITSLLSLFATFVTSAFTPRFLWAFWISFGLCMLTCFAAALLADPTQSVGKWLRNEE